MGVEEKGVGVRSVGVLPLRVVENVDLLDDRASLVRQEGPLWSKTGAKCRLDEWRVRAHSTQLPVIHRQFTLKLYQLAHLLLITRAEESAKKDEDQRIAIQEPQMFVEETGPREV